MTFITTLWVATLTFELGIITGAILHSGMIKRAWYRHKEQKEMKRIDKMLDSTAKSFKAETQHCACCANVPNKPTGIDFEIWHREFTK